MRALFIATLVGIGSLDPGAAASALDPTDSTLCEHRAEDGVGLTNDADPPLSRDGTRARVDLHDRWRLAPETCPPGASRASSSALARQRRWRHRRRSSTSDSGH